MTVTACYDMASMINLDPKPRIFKFTGGEITGEFLMSAGYLPGAHGEGCPVYKEIEKLGPAWAQ